MRAFNRFVPALAAAALLSAAGCEFLDPTQVDNPQTTAEDLARADRPTEALLPGLRAQFARALRAVVTISENVSDNYSIHGTGLLKELDEPRAVLPPIINATGGAGIYWNLQELRALGIFVIDDIIPADPTATGEQRAEALFYRGMAFLMFAENFVAAPLERDAEPVAGEDLLQLGIADFEASLAAAPAGVRATAARAALARAHRLAGDAAQAQSFAEDALADDAAFVFAQDYDATSVDNTPNAFLVQRALQEMQPLPRLDFLDPKYISEESPIPFAKAEEMHLILADIAIEAGSYPVGAQRIADAVALARSRPTALFNDGDLRKNGDLTIRPRDSEIAVAACETCPYRSGLVLDRPGTVVVPLISGSSLDPDSVRTLTAEGDVRHALHLARQEILFLEGRRMSDLGIRLPMMLREIDANENIDEGDFGTLPIVPDYIPDRDDMDLFVPQSPYEGQTDPVLIDTTVYMLVDMNRVLADARVSPLTP
ncbi:MAG TPA: hypothetical protein VMM12_02220 [Longimicrobiales bacterium]|nr:hypothetical protein [Longimicrobiales bacterium]